MWTPKRILILLGGLILFLTGFSIYAYFLGGIDGLPPLPDVLKPPRPGEVVNVPLADMGNEADQKLRTAFGADCQELKRSWKLDLRSKGWVLSTETLEFTTDGCVHMRPFSACIFPKMDPDAKFPEINTIRCDSALVKFDQPVHGFMDLNNRKVTNVTLKANQGSPGVVIKNNRQTPDLLDDIEVTISQAPLFYDEGKSLIWSDGNVRLLDLQSQPHATVVEAAGMELHLAKDTSPPKNDKGKRPKADNINGVDLLVLRSNVDMKLAVDAGSGFLGNDLSRNKNDKTSPVASKPAEKSRIFIKTPGRFTYDLPKEIAVFEGAAGSAELVSPPQVLAERVHETAAGVSPLWDRLVCDRLELRFRRKKADPGPRRDTRSPDKEIDSALATGKEVHLAMETENLSAHGTELFFQCASDKAGPQTLLKGQPLRAQKDYHKLVANELLLVGADKNGEGQHSRAKGPGQIDIFDKTNPLRDYPMHAVWKDQLTSSKVKEGNKVYDLLTLTQEASFIDEERKQELHGERLEVLLEPTAAPAESEALKQNAPGAPRQKPFKIDAFGKVWALSSEFIVRKADYLAVRFRDEAPPNERLPETLPLAPPKSADKTDGAQGGTNPPPPPASPEAAVTGTPEKPRPPVELEGRLVTAVIKRGGIKDQLHELIVDGAVHVHQDGEKAEDKGVDIKGRLLQLLYHPKGHILYVYAEEKKHAELQLGELYLRGPKVTINQQDNTAEVDGDGAMSLPSNTTFEGGKPTKAGTRLEVWWNKNMVFDGQIARFYGGIQAKQENAQLLCNNLQVKLDRLVSFKEGQKKDENAKVDKIVCELKVNVVEEILDQQKKLLKYNQLKSVYLTMDNLDEKVYATGPGEIVALALGNADLGPGPGGAPKNNPPTTGAASAGVAQQMMLTRILYDGRVWNNNKEKISRVYDNVQVFHFPAERPDATMNANQPPKNSLWLRCDQLTVYTRDLGQGKVNRIVNAKGKVDFRSDTGYGQAESVTYEESGDQVIFEGTQGNPARLWQRLTPGADPREIRARKILYNRKTGAVSTDGTELLQSPR